MGKTYPNTSNSNLNRIANSAPLPNHVLNNSRAGSSMALNANNIYQQFYETQKQQAKNPIIMRAAPDKHQVKIIK